MTTRGEVNMVDRVTGLSSRLMRSLRVFRQDRVEQPGQPSWKEVKQTEAAQRDKRSAKSQKTVKKREKSPSEKLLDLINPRTKELFHTDDREPFITLWYGILEMTWSLMSPDLMHHLAGEFFKAAGKSISTQEMQAALAGC